MSEFSKPKDTNGVIRIVGSSKTFDIPRSQFKSLMVKLSEAYAKSKGDIESMNRVIDSLFEAVKMDDPLASRGLRANTIDVIERIYDADPNIKGANQLTIGGRYMLKHRELVRSWHAEADQPSE